MRGKVTLSLAMLALAASTCSFGSAEASEIQPYQSQEIQPYQSSEIKPYQSSEIQPYQSSEIKPYQASEIKPYQSSEIKPYQSSEIKPYQSSEIKPYQAEQVQPDAGTGAKSAEQGTPNAEQDLRRQVIEQLVVLKIGDNRAAAQGSLRDLDVAPVISQGRTYVPLRFISEVFGAHVDWNSQTRTITISHGQHVIQLWPGKTSAVVDGQQVQLDAAPQTVKGRTLVPIRFISENLDKDVYYDQASREIMIYPKGALQIQPYRADEIQPYQAQEIEQYQAQEITPYQADGIDPYQAQEIQKQQSQTVKKAPPAAIVKILPKGSAGGSNSTSSSGASGQSSSGLLFSPADGFHYSDPNGFWGTQWLNPLGW